MENIRAVDQQFSALQQYIGIVLRDYNFVVVAVNEFPKIMRFPFVFIIGRKLEIMDCYELADV